MVETIGKPVFHRYSGDLFGSWLMDAYEFTDEEEKTKIWATVSENNKTLFEFSNKTMYRENRPTKNYTLPKPFTVSCTTFVCDVLASPHLQGNDHVVYNGSFFYYNHGEIPRIIRYQLSTKTIGDPLEIRPNGVVRNGGGPLLTQLYKPQQPGSYLDFSTDENGLWGVFGLALDNNTVVMKFDSETLEIQVETSSLLS